MTRYLVDTDICIDLLRGRRGDLFRRSRARSADDIGISTITLAELLVGAAKTTRPNHHRQLIAQLCAPFAILAFDALAAEAYASVRSELEHLGTPIGPLDTLIAAHALSRGLTLLSGNLREFERVAGLNVEAWS
jgi:tRNA(fMet)-specific endonuclease VapC